MSVSPCYRPPSSQTKFRNSTELSSEEERNSKMKPNPHQKKKSKKDMGYVISESTHTSLFNIFLKSKFSKKTMYCISPSLQLTHFTLIHTRSLKLSMTHTHVTQKHHGQGVRCLRSTCRFIFSRVYQLSYSSMWLSQEDVYGKAGSEEVQMCTMRRESRS